MYTPNAAKPMPKPGNSPLNRFHLENGPVYRQASLESCYVSKLHLMTVVYIARRTFSPKDRSQVSRRTG
jgi:hypothetical protein